MPKVNLGKLKAGVKSRESSRHSLQSQASISSFFSPKKVDDGEQNVPKSSSKRPANETPSHQDPKRQKTLQNEDKTTSPYIKISSNTLTKLKNFENNSKYFNNNDRKEQNCSDINVGDDDTAEKNISNCITMDDEPKPATKNIDMSSYTRDKLTDLSLKKSPNSSDLKSKEKSPLSGAKNPITKTQYTPLEQQFMEIKDLYKDAVLFVECGYKYKFFGEDAEIASKELNIMCFMNHNFMVASIPTHRLHVHVKRLVNKGYKVGVVKQTETAALKAVGDNKSSVFTRELSALYTKTTLIGEDMRVADDTCSSNDSDDGIMDASSGYLMCLYWSDKESGATGNKSMNEKNETFCFMAVQPLTGSIIFDEFSDTSRCSELETRLQHIGVAELLISDTLPKHVKSFVKLMASQAVRPEDSIRIEEIPAKYFSLESAKKYIQDLAENNDKISPSSKDTEVSSETSIQQKITSLPQNVQMCYAVLFRYLKDFKLERVLGLTSNFVRFTGAQRYMKLDGCTVKNLELFKNEQGSEQCTLFWILNHCKTNFGKRLLKKWVSQPLMDTKEIEARLDCVSEILTSDAQCLRKLQALLVRLPDLERGLCSVYSKKCSPNEFLTFLKYLINLYETISATQLEASTELSSSLLLKIYTEVPQLLKGADRFLSMLDHEAARTGDKTKLFRDVSQFPDIEKCTTEMRNIVEELKSHRSHIRRTLQNPSIDYCTVSGNEYLVEVRNTKLGSVPCDWIKISATKQVSRFRTPFVETQYRLLCQQREILNRVCNQAWLDYLEMVNERYPLYSKAVQIVAVADCLFSLATVARQPGYTRPVLKDSSSAHLHISQGRHPILDTLLSENEQYVPNDTNLKGTGNRCMVITGPNMGGKSCYIKQVALIAIMAQIGSFVPANHVELSPLDAVHTRMGSSDNIYKGRSTFMVELEEAAFILDQATSRSLVILDELGRGTSTHDGIAVAYATLHHILDKIGCLTLFVTHYPDIAEIDKTFPNHVTNNHMAFMTSSDPHSPEKNDGKHVQPSVTFLYRLVEGVAQRSYGLNVARLAEIPRDILDVAARKSSDMEHDIISRRTTRHQFQKTWYAKTVSDMHQIEY